MAQIKDLPVELLYRIATCVELPSDINALLRTNSTFHPICERLLYEEIKSRSLEIETPDPDQRENRGSKRQREGPLNWAAENGKHVCARRLLHAGVPLWPSIHRLSPIVVAAQRGDLEMVEILISHDPSMIDEPCIWEWDGDDKRQAWRFLGSPLTYAIANGHMPVVEFLIKNGATLHFPDDQNLDQLDRIQPLHQALDYTPNEAIAKKLLLEHESEHDDFSTRSLLRIAASTSFEMFKLVKDTRSLPVIDDTDFWTTVISSAISSGDVRTVKFLFEHGVRPTMVATEICHPDHWKGPSAPNNIFNYIASTPPEYPELIAFLLQQINIDFVIDGSSLQALICTICGAVKVGDEELLCRLLRTDWINKKPSINNERWREILEQICLYPVTHSENVQILNASLGHGVPVTWKCLGADDPPYSRQQAEESMRWSKFCLKGAVILCTTLKMATMEAVFLALLVYWNLLLVVPLHFGKRLPYTD